MKKSLSVAMAAFLSLGMLSACGTQNRNVGNQNDNRVSYQPVRYNPYKQVDNNEMTRDGRFFTITPDRWNQDGSSRWDYGSNRWYQFGPDVGYNQGTFPNFNQQTVPGNNQIQNNNNPNVTPSPAPNTNISPAPNTNQSQAPNTNNNTANQPSSKAPTNQAAIGDFQSKVIQLTNQQRQKNGLPPLQADAQVSKVAQAKTDDMSTHHYFSHTSPTYGSPFKMLKDFGVDYTTAAENIAEGQTSPQEVVNSWMNSAGHRQNILSRSVTRIGVGYTKNGNYWSQMFIGK